MSEQPWVWGRWQQLLSANLPVDIVAVLADRQPGLVSWQIPSVSRLSFPIKPFHLNVQSTPWQVKNDLNKTLLLYFNRYLFFQPPPLSREGLGNLIKHYGSRFFGYLEPNSSKLQLSAVVTFCLEINLQNCIGLTHWHVLCNMCTSTRAFLSTCAQSGPTLYSAAPIGCAGHMKECTQSSETVCWKRPHNVSFPFIRWPLRHPDGLTKYRLTLSIISSHSINVWLTRLCICVCALVTVCVHVQQSLNAQVIKTTYDCTVVLASVLRG